MRDDAKECPLTGFELDGDGGGKRFDPCGNATPGKSALQWFDYTGDYGNAREWLEAESGLDESLIDILTEEETRPRMMHTKDCMIVVMRGANLNPGAEPTDMISIRAYIDRTRIITIHKQRMKAVADVAALILSMDGPDTPGRFVSVLAVLLCENMQPALTAIGERTDEIEETVFKRPDVALRQTILELRRGATIYRRHLVPQRDLLAKLRALETSFFDDGDRHNLQEAYDDMIRNVENLDATLGRAQIVQDELGNVVSEQLSRNMFFLSAIAAIFMPLGFLTGLLGVNVAGIPGAGHPRAFWAFCSILVVVVFLQILFFKRRKWF